MHIADPANPEREPNVVAYPAAGTPNADVRLFIASVGGGRRRRRAGEDGDGRAGRAGRATGGQDGAGGQERARAGRVLRVSRPSSGTPRVPYLVTVSWGDRLLVVTQTRDQRLTQVLDGETGAALRTDSDPQWIDIIPGVPAEPRRYASPGPR